jgi:hypothetical protein
LLFLPQVTAREARPFGERGEFCPDHRSMDFRGGGRAGKAAIGAGDHVLPADHARKAYNPLCDELRMLNQIGGVRDDPRDQQLPFRQLDAFPDPPLVLVTRIGGFKGIGGVTGLRRDEDDNNDDREEKPRQLATGAGWQ